MAIGAPPGTITNGSLAPSLAGPKDCSSEPSPHSKNVALMRLTVSEADKSIARATRKTEVIGTAAMTSTCCRPNSSSWEKGNRLSTSDTAVSRVEAAVCDMVGSLRVCSQIDLGVLLKKSA